MWTIRKPILILLALCSAVACNKESYEETTPVGSDNKLVIEAVAGTISNPGMSSKATGVYGYQVLWDAKDKIAVTDGTNRGQFELIEGVRETVGKFKQSTEDTQTYGSELTGYYPATLMQADGSLVWPFSQRWSETLSGIPMTATATLKTEGTTFNFKNLGGILQLVLTSPEGEMSLKSITVSAGNAGLSGPFTVNNGAADGFQPGTTITLDCSGSSIGPAAKVFNIAIPAKDYTNMQLRFETLDNKVKTLTSSKLSISRGVVSKVTLALSGFERSFSNYLSFTAIGCDIPFGIKKGSLSTVSPDDIDLQYSFDPASGSWTNFSAKAAENGVQFITDIPQGKTVFIRASQKISAFGKFGAWWTFDFGNTAAKGGRIVAGGNIMSLLNPDADGTEVGDYAFYKLFSDVKELSVAPSMPATSIGKSGYESMYSYCTNLREAPELPATSLSENCYVGMFEGCSSLEKAPETLPATELAEYCYAMMFSGCKKLVNAPHLPAKTLVEGCYAQIFSNCSSLKTISVDFSTWQNSLCRSEWVLNVPSGGTFYCPAGLQEIVGTDYERGYFIPAGWAVIRTSIPDDYPVGSVFEIDGVEVMLLSNSYWEKRVITTTNLGSDDSNVIGTAFSADDLKELKKSQLWENGWRLPDISDMSTLAELTHSETGNGTSWDINGNTFIIPYTKDLTSGSESRLWLDDEESYYYFNSNGSHGFVPASQVSVKEFYIRLVKSF